MDSAEASEVCSTVLNEIKQSVIVDPMPLELILVGILARGHVLLEDVPGTGKTLIARSFSTALGLSFSRIQFTPDLLPTDVTGTHIFNEKDRVFEFREGPIFAHVVLGDEINRAPPKTQAALLEAMEEHQVTVGGETSKLPDPFFVIATQNPVETEGTFPLPEAQIDRFVIKTSLGYPALDDEVELLRRRSERIDRSPSVASVLGGEEDVRELQAVPETIHVNEDIQEYIAQITRATREDRRVEVGVSPRGTQRLFETTRAYAVIQGRSFVTPDDVKAVAQAVLAHRLVLTPEASVGEETKESIVQSVLDNVAVPTVE